jgi:NAD(P)H-hydrate epimerase
MPANIITREIAPLPDRNDAAHKGEVGRIAIIGGCFSEVVMVGAPALAANAALRTGAGLVQMLVPEALRTSVGVLAPCATTRTLPMDADALMEAVSDFGADVVALGPGLGDSLTPEVIIDFLSKLTKPVVLDADGLNQLAARPGAVLARPQRIVMTPHPGELARLLSNWGIDVVIDARPDSRRSAALALAQAYGCIVVLKGRGTVVTNAERLYVNETGNAGMATGGTGDVLTGVIAALIGQNMDPYEAAILGVYLHGLAGDFAAEELGRWSMTALDLVEYLPEAFSEYGMSLGE